MFVELFNCESIDKVHFPLKHHLSELAVTLLSLPSINRLQEKVEHFESFSKDAALSLKVLDEGMSFVNSEIASMKENIKLWEEKNSEGGEEASGRDRNIEG